MKNLLLILISFIPLVGYGQVRFGEMVVFYVEPQNRVGSNHGKAIAPAIATGFAGSMAGDSIDIVVLWADVPFNLPKVRHATSINNAFLSESWSTIAEAIAWGVDLYDSNQDLFVPLTPNTQDYSDWYYDIAGVPETFLNDTVGGLGDDLLMTKWAARQAIAGLESDITTGLSGKSNTGHTHAYADITGKPSLFDGTWSSLSGKPTTFQPSAHSHAPSDIVSPPWLTSFTETDPNVPAYSKTLTAFSVIKASTDPLYRPIGYVPSWSEIISKPSFATVATTGDYNDLSNKPTIPTISGSTGSFGFVTTSNGLVTSGKRLELYSGTTNASGNYVVTFGTAYSVAPNIQASITNQSNVQQQIRVSSVSTTGFTVNVSQRNTAFLSLLGIDILSASVTNVNGATVDVLVTEK